MKGSFQYEWWTVEVQLGVGRYEFEFKGKDKCHVVRQIQNYVKKTNSPKNLQDPWKRAGNPVQEVYWETLKLDRIGYQRLF